MTFLLTDIFDDKIEWQGKTYKVNLMFDNILLMFEMLDDNAISKYEKPLLVIAMLIDGETPKFDSYSDAVILYIELLKTFLDIDLSEEKGETPSIRTFDYKKDAEVIYASFMAEYKMDLFEMHGKLHWKKFVALFSNLNDESKFKQIVGYRVMKTPTAKEASEEYRKHIIKMKELYSLDERSTEEKIDNAFDRVSAMLKG